MAALWQSCCAAVVLMPTAGAVTSDAFETAPLPSVYAGNPAVPRIEFGTVNVLPLRDLPLEMQRDAEEGLSRRNEIYEMVEDDDDGWPLPLVGPMLMRTDERAGTLAVTPLDVGGTELGSYRFLGSPPGIARPGEIELGLARYFQRPDGVLVILTESQLEGQGAAVYVKEAVNARVHGQPAMLTVAKSPDGKVRSTLSWASESVDYELSVMDDVLRPRGHSRYGRAWLIKLAEGLPS